MFYFNSTRGLTRPHSSRTIRPRSLSTTNSKLHKFVELGERRPIIIVRVLGRFRCQSSQSWVCIRGDGIGKYTTRVDPVSTNGYGEEVSY